MWLQHRFTTCFFVFFYISSVVSKIQITKKHHGSTSLDVHLECTPDKDPAGSCDATLNPKDYVLIQAYRDTNTAIANVQIDNKVNFNTILNGVQANGQIASKPGDATYLSVTLSNVVKEDSGVYTCVFHYMDSKGRLHQESSSEDVTIREPDLSDVVRSLTDKLSHLETVVEELKKKHVPVLEEHALEQAARLATLEGRIISSEIAFSVGITDAKTLNKSSRAVYNKVFTSIGGGYDTATGIFTCPLSGAYVFHWHGLTLHGKAIQLDLRHNGNYVASLYTQADDEYVSAGNSVILRLTKDEKVYISAGADSGLYNKPKDLYATFSGYLIG